MILKLFEVRDEGTHIGAFAFDATDSHATEQERYLLRRSGFDGLSLVVFGYIDGTRKTEYDPECWGGRTMRAAHYHVMQHWHELKSGDVIDVEFVLGETTTRKESERNG